MLRRMILALALGGALLGASPLAAPAQAATPLVGSCHQLTLDQAMTGRSDPSVPVPCSGSHTTQTVAVVASPSLTGMTDDQISAQGARLCAPALIKAEGTRLRFAQTAYQGLFFAPTAAEVAAGESWYRCDIALRAGTSLARLPKHLPRPLVPRRIPDSVRICYAGSLLTTCSHRHTQRSIGAFTSPAKPFPSKAAFLRYARAKCPGSTGYLYPSTTDWNSGYRVIVCFKKTRH